MRHLLVFAVIVLAATACGSRSSSKDTAVEEYAVFSALLETSWQFGRGAPVKRVVVSDRTAVRGSQEEFGRMLDYAAKQTPAITSEMGADMRSRNAQPRAIESRLRLSFDYVLLNQQERSQFSPGVREQSCADAFQAKYGDSYGVATFSRPGFNKARDKAVIYFETSSCGVGAGFVVLMAKTGGDWKVKERTLVWFQ